MTLDHANRILDRIREGYPMPLAITTQALQRTGDISGLFDKPLRTNGDESSHDRAIPFESKGIEKGFSYSAYLDCPKNKGTQE
ncbi:hypothetical protein EBT25_09710 [bacterium]|nr:hypothetical protein [bacterium]